jgi:hypothetical protein
MEEVPMKRKKWYFQSGERYLLDEVILACDIRLREGGVKKVKSKNEMVRWMEKHAPSTIVWHPKGRRGWGASPFNSKCWRTVGGKPIDPPDETGLCSLEDVQISRT